MEAAPCGGWRAAAGSGARWAGVHAPDQNKAPVEEHPSGPGQRDALPPQWCLLVWKMTPSARTARSYQKTNSRFIFPLPRVWGKKKQWVVKRKSLLHNTFVFEWITVLIKLEPMWHNSFPVATFFFTCGLVKVCSLVRWVFSTFVSFSANIVDTKVWNVYYLKKKGGRQKALRVVSPRVCVCGQGVPPVK